MYEPTRLLLSFNIAGVKYYDAAFVMDDLKVGSPLTLEPEPENPHDSQAVKISFNGKKLGYVPASMCDSLAPFCSMVIRTSSSAFCRRRIPRQRRTNSLRSASTLRMLVRLLACSIVAQQIVPAAR